MNFYTSKHIIFDTLPNLRNVYGLKVSMTNIILYDQNLKALFELFDID